MTGLKLVIAKFHIVPTFVHVSNRCIVLGPPVNSFICHHVYRHLQYYSSTDVRAEIVHKSLKAMRFANFHYK